MPDLIVAVVIRALIVTVFVSALIGALGGWAITALLKWALS